MKIFYPLFFSILLLSACDIDTGSGGNGDKPNETVFVDSSALDYPQYVLPPKPISHSDISESEVGFIKKAELGKVLFFTKINGSACSDCHSPKHGFTAGQQQSCGRGCAGVPPNRVPVNREIADIPPIKSPSSIGVFGSENLLWGGLAGSEKAPWAGLVNAIFDQGMLATKAHDMKLVADSILMHHPSTFDRFKDIYVNVEADSLSDPIFVSECLAAFQMRLIPNNSQFQKWLKGEMAMSEKAKHGLKIFDNKCANCHEPPFLGKDEFVNVGFPHLVNNFHKGNHRVNDGWNIVTENSQDTSKFRIMRLATNVTQHIRWGHGGTFKTLEDCIAGHQNIDSVSVAEIDDIIEFLNMTTDRDLLEMVPQ